MYRIHEGEKAKKKKVNVNVHLQNPQIHTKPQQTYHEKFKSTHVSDAKPVDG